MVPLNVFNHVTLVRLEFSLLLLIDIHLPSSATISILIAVTYFVRGYFGCMD